MKLVLQSKAWNDILWVRVASLPMKYLKLPLGVAFKAKTIWDDIVEKKKY